MKARYVVITVLIIIALVLWGNRKWHVGSPTEEADALFTGETSTEKSLTEEFSSKEAAASEEESVADKDTEDVNTEEANTENPSAENPNAENPNAEDAGTEKTDEEDADAEGSEQSQLADSSGLKTPANSGRLHVDGIHIKNEKDEIVQLKGLSTHGIAWFPDYINDALFHEFRYEWNSNIIRLAMYTEEYGGYMNSDKNNLKAMIDNGVKYATDNDMYVIIDWHILSDNDPNKNKSEAIKFFKEMSSLYHDYKNVLYEICNEPNGGTTWQDIKKYAEEVIPAIRENDAEAIIIVGTPNWSQFVDKAAEDPIKGYDNIMYTLHFYADTHKDDLRNTMENALKKGLPIFVTEYGICDASGNGAINTDEAEKWMKLMNEYNISSCAWNISNKSETSAIFKSSVSKKSGFSESDLSSSGKWVYTMLTGKEKYTPQPPVSNSPTGGVQTQSGAFQLDVQEVNFWTSDVGNCHQLSLTVTNTGGDVSNWTVVITFDQPISFQQGWGGSFSVNGNTLTISNEAYNGTIANGESVKDIGCILAF